MSKATDEQKMIHILASALLAHGEANECIEKHDDGAWVHGLDCPNYCDYACGAVWIAYTPSNEEGDSPTITAVQNAGTLSVDLPEWP